MKFGVYMVCFIVMSLLLIFAFVVVHEFGHQQISIYHGCVESEMNVTLFGGSFLCTKYRVRSEAERLQEVQMQSWQEIVGYNLLVAITAYLMISTFNKNIIE